MSWNIAKEMARINEENLSKLSRKGLYEKLKDSSYKSRRRIYRYKKASQDQLTSIKTELTLQNLQSRRKRVMLMSVLIAIMVISIMIILTVNI